MKGRLEIPSAEAALALDRTISRCRRSKSAHTKSGSIVCIGRFCGSAVRCLREPQNHAHNRVRGGIRH
jgi:hypothetical protein